MLREKNGPQLFIIQAEVPHRNENKYKNDLNNRSSWSCQSKYFFRCTEKVPQSIAV